MLEYKVKIALAPIRRNNGPRPGLFNPDYAVARKREICAYIYEKYAGDNVAFVDLDFLNDEGLISDDADAERAAEALTAQKVDALFVINCNFGDEEAAGRMAKKIGKPVLIWAPLDDIFEPDGIRYTDSQCGLFAVSKYLQRNHIPFSHIPNCRITDPEFDAGLRRFISVACMVKNFVGMRILQIGLRPKPFTSVIVNEGELMERFGISVVPVNLAVIIQKHREIMETMDEALEKDIASFKSRFDVTPLGDPQLKRMMAFRHLYKALLAEYQCDVIAGECWTAMQIAVDAMPCCAMGELADERIIVACETDIHGAITLALLSAASLGRSVPFFLEFTVRHPENPNVEMLWHCGPAAYSLKKAGAQAKVFNHKCSFPIKDGQYTIARMDMIGGEYALLAGRFKSADGPYNFGNYIWAEFDDFKKWEKKAIDGPYIHHMAEIEGDYVDVLAEFCKFIPNLNIDLP